MILKYAGRNLFIDGRLLSFREEIRMAAVYGDYVVVLAERLFFHDFVSFSVPVRSVCFLEEKIYFQDGGIYSITGPYDKPVLELVAPGTLVGVKWGYLILRRKNNVFSLRKGQEETLVDLSKGLGSCCISRCTRTGQVSSTEMGESCADCGPVASLCTHGTQTQVECLGEYILFAREGDVLFLDRELNTRIHRFASSVHFAGLVEIEGKLHLAVNDRVFSGADVDERYRIVERPAVAQNYYEMVHGAAQLLQRTGPACVVELCFRTDERDKILAGGAFQAGNASSGEAMKVFTSKRSRFERELFKRYPLGCTEEEAVAFFESEMLKRKSPAAFARANIDAISSLSPVYCSKFRAFLDADDAESSPECCTGRTSAVPVRVEDLKEYLLQAHKGRQVKYESAGGSAESRRLVLRRTYRVKESFVNYRALLRTPWVSQHSAPVRGDAAPLFKLDEADIENRRERAYVLRKASFSSLPLLNLYPTSVDFPDLSLGVTRGQEEPFRVPHKDWDKNLRFNYGVCTVLSKGIGEEILLFEGNKPSVLTRIFAEAQAGERAQDHECSKNAEAALIAREYELAGQIYALGILGLVKFPLPPVTEFVDFAAQISLSLSVRADYTLLPLPEALLKRTASIISLGFSFRGTRNQHVAGILERECSRFGLINGKSWVDEYYRLSAGLSLYLVGHKWASFDDRLVEVVYNGLTFFGTRNTFVLKRLRRGRHDRMEEVFYSSFFSKGVMGEYEEVEGFEEGMALADIYRKAGEYFYIGVSSVVHGDGLGTRLGEDACVAHAARDEPEDPRARKMVELCLAAEEAMEKSPEYKFLFDILLVSVSLLFNGTSNTDVLRIIRRQLLKVSKLGSLHKITDFVDGRYETQYGLRYGDYIRYKMCIGLLFVELQRDSLFEIVSSLYVNFPLSTTDQRAFQIYRHLLVTKAGRIRRHACSDIGLDIEGPVSCTDEMSRKDKMIFFDALCRHLEERGTAEGVDLAAFGLSRELYDSAMGR